MNLGWFGPWEFLLWGYLLSVVVETPILVILLTKRHSTCDRVFAGLWLTACTYPIVSVVLPLTVESTWGRTSYLVVAETFAPLAECLLFTLALGWNRTQGCLPWRDWLAIVLANLASFGVGELVYYVANS